MAELDYLERFRSYTEIFYSYFPGDRKDRDLVVIRGHQLVESLLFRFLRDHTSSPEHLDDFHVRWGAAIALVKAMRYSNQPEEEWVWTSAIRLEKARNRVAHYLDSKESERFVLDFVNCVRANYSRFTAIPGDDDLKKAIFILYFILSALLALEEFPPCTATHLVREQIIRTCQSIVLQGLPSGPVDS